MIIFFIFIIIIIIKKVLNAIQNDNEDCICYELKSQGFILSYIRLPASSRTRSLL